MARGNRSSWADLKVISDLISRRIELGLSQQALADLAGVTRARVAHFEAKRRVPTLGLIYKLATAMRKKVRIKLVDGDI